MRWNVTVVPRTLHFRQPAGTSRGVYLTRDVWYLVARSPEGSWGVGECAPLPDLSCERGPGYEPALREAVARFEREGDLYGSVPASLPSVRFGLETAVAHARAGSLAFWKTPFSEGAEGIPINGLVWMGSHEEMLVRLEEKIAAGFRCIKLKIGAIDFAHELDLMERIRDRFPSPSELELRLDANGAFSPGEAMAKLEALSRFHPHSIEQPIRQGQWTELARICRDSPIPIALDEELIALNETGEKERMLDAVHPAYLVLKPSLHGGMQGSEEWIRLAGERGVGNWVTSALESNVGLNAIAQWRARTPVDMPQGLGTGLLFTDNIDYPLVLDGAFMKFRPEQAGMKLANYGFPDLP